MAYVTRGLLSVLLETAADSEPESVTVGLSATRAGDLSGVGDPSGAAGPDGLPADARVLTHMYLPEVGGSVSAVFGMDLSTPVGGTDGRFISHPTGGLGVSTTDDLHDVMLVAVPPWGPDSVGAFDRRGRRRPLEVVDAAPPEGSLS